MDSLRSLGKDVVNFKEQLHLTRNYLETHEEPQGCESTIHQFRTEIENELNNVSTEHSKLSSHSSITEQSRKLLKSVEQLVDKRELYLSQYGYKPTTRHLPQYPIYNERKEANLSGKSVSETKRNDLEGVPNSPEKHPKLHVSPKSLIAKYTPKKQRCISADNYKSTDAIYSNLESRYRNDPGDKTYTIKVPKQEAKEETVDRLVSRYSIIPNDFKRSNTAKQMHSGPSPNPIVADKNDHLQRLQRYSVLPSKQPDFAQNCSSGTSGTAVLSRYTTVHSHAIASSGEGFVVPCYNKTTESETLCNTSYDEEFVAVQESQISACEDAFEMTTLIAPNSPVLCSSAPVELSRDPKKAKYSNDMGNLLSENIENAQSTNIPANFSPNIFLKYGTKKEAIGQAISTDTSNNESGVVAIEKVVPARASVLNNIMSKYGSKYNK